MVPPNAVRVADLRAEFQLPQVFSQKGFERALNILDQNADYFIDDFELFDIFGVERSCLEYMTLLGFDNYPQLVPQTLYYGECPLDNDSTLFEFNTCPDTNNDHADQNDAQVALDSLMSLSFYLRANRDVIEELESDALYFQCTPDNVEKSPPQPLVRKNETIKGKKETGMNSQIRKSSGEKMLDEEVKNGIFESIDGLKTYQWLTEGLEPDPELLEYIQGACDQARLKNPANMNVSVRAIMTVDSFLENNPIDDYLPEKSSSQLVLDCSPPH